MRDVTARTTARIPPTDITGRGRQVDGIMPAGGLTETTRQTTSAEDPSSDAISFCLPIKWRLTVCTRYGYPKPTHQCGASGGRGGHARPAEGWRAEPAIALGELVEPCATTLTIPFLHRSTPSRSIATVPFHSPLRPFRIDQLEPLLTVNKGTESSASRPAPVRQSNVGDRTSGDSPSYPSGLGKHGMSRRAAPLRVAQIAAMQSPTV